jgi:UDP-glucose 4-epimerase
MKALVICGAGFMGSNLVRACRADAGIGLIGAGFPDPRIFQREIAARYGCFDTVSQGDLLDEALLSDLVRGQDVIFNCAAQTSHPLSIREPLLDVRINCVGNLVLLEAVRRVNPEATVVYPSSSTVIGKALMETVAKTTGNALWKFTPPTKARRKNTTTSTIPRTACAPS